MSIADLTDVLFLRNYNTQLVVLSTALLGLSSGLVGTFLLLRKRSLLGDALSHATLPGIAAAFAIMVALGGTGKWLPGLLMGATVSGVAGIMVMLAIRHTTRLKDDVGMGFVLSVFFGAGVALLSMVQRMPGGSAAGLETFIYGKPASIIRADFYLIAAATIATAAASILLVKEFTLLCFDEGFARTEGWPTFLLDVMLVGLVTVVTVTGLQAVGLILIIAFLITPATAARFWTEKLSLMLILSAAIGAASGWLGASISALFPNLPAGAVIVLVAATIFLFSMLFAPARGVIPRFIRGRKLSRKVGRQHFLRAMYELLEAQGDPDDPIASVPNIPVPLEAVLAKRAWKRGELKQILKIADAEDHVEPVAQGYLRLSEPGFGEAARVTRNHRLWETYLVTHADIAPSHVDRDADMVEHVLGADLVRELEEVIRREDSEMADAAVPPSPHEIARP